MSIPKPRESVWILEPSSEFRNLLADLSLLLGNATCTLHDLSSARRLLKIPPEAGPPRLILFNWEIAPASDVRDWAQETLQLHPHAQMVCLSATPPPEGVLPSAILAPKFPQFLSELLQILTSPKEVS